MAYSETEFESIYIRNFPLGMKIALSLLNEEEDARDVVQGVFLKLWESNIKIENPQAYIIRAVRNSCISRINSLDVRKRIKSKISLEPPPDDNEYFQKIEEINKAIPQLLTNREQDVVERIYSDGMSYKEAAENLNVSVATINKNIVSSLKKLRNHFNSRKYD